MKILSGISFVIAIVATVFAIIFLATIPSFVEAGAATTGWDSFGYGIAVVGLIYYSLCASLVACVASIVPAFSYNSIIKISARAIIVLHLVGWLLIFVIGSIF